MTRDEALRALIAECEWANEEAVRRFECSVISYNLLDKAHEALTGERRATFCGGYPSLRQPPLIPKAEPLKWEDQP